MKYSMRAEVVPYPGMGGWYFLTLPKKQAAEIKTKYGKSAKGWGSIPVTVALGKSTWKTSVFPDKKAGSYLLPLKAAVRKKEGVGAGDKVKFEMEIK